MTTITVTPLEVEGLLGIAYSDYMDGWPRAGWRVWTWSANPFPKARTFSGVTSSLVKKGLVITSGYGEEACLELTTNALAVLVAAGKLVRRMDEHGEFHYEFAS